MPLPAPSGPTSVGDSIHNVTIFISSEESFGSAERPSEAGSTAGIFVLFALAIPTASSLGYTNSASVPFGMAFFSAGLYYLYRRQYLGLFVTILIGTFNRENSS